jgi:hypothetical protein
MERIKRQESRAKTLGREQRREPEIIMVRIDIVFRLDSWLLILGSQS